MKPWFPGSKWGNIMCTASIAMFLKASVKKPYASFFNTLCISLTEGKIFWANELKLML